MGLESYRNRLKILERELEMVSDRYKEVIQMPDDDGVVQQKVELMTAMHVIQGRVLEMKVWIEWALKWPHIERPDQLPTERNTIQHGSIQDTQSKGKAQRGRQERHQRDANDLVAALPGLD